MTTHNINKQCHFCTTVFFFLYRICQRHPGPLIRCLSQTNPSEEAVRLLTLTKVRAICELRLPLPLHTQEILLWKARALPNDLFFSPARSRFIPVYCRKWGASDICLKLKPNKLLASFSFFAGDVRPCRHERSKAETRFELPSQITKGRWH